MIISAAVDMLLEEGFGGLSLRRLAARLGVKPASLYNHIDGVDDVRVGVAIRAAGALEAELISATEGREKGEAFVRACHAYRSFATNNPELYRVYIASGMLDDPRMLAAGKRSFSPIIELIRAFGLSDTDTLNFHRALRSAIHGYIELSNNGFLTRGGVSRDESYQIMIDEFLKLLENHHGKGGDEI